MRLVPRIPRSAPRGWPDAALRRRACGCAAKPADLPDAMGEHMAGALQWGLPLHTKANGAQRGVQFRLGHGGTLKGKGLPQPGQQPLDGRRCKSTPCGR